MAALLASLSYLQTLDCRSIGYTDTTNYPTSEAKSTINNRSIYLYLSDGSTMLADGSIVKNNPPIAIPFPFSMGDTIYIPFTKDVALTVLLVLVSNAPQTGSVYQFSMTPPLTCFMEQYAQNLQQGTQAQQALENDQNYKDNLFGLYMEIANVQNAAKYLTISSQQKAIDRAYARYIDNENNAF